MLVHPAALVQSLLVANKERFRSDTHLRRVTLPKQRRERRLGVTRELGLEGPPRRPGLHDGVDRAFGPDSATPPGPTSSSLSSLRSRTTRSGSTRSARTKYGASATVK